MTILKFKPLSNFTIADAFIEHQVKSELENQINNQFSPKIDISEDEKNFYLECELPGLKKEEISLSVENDVLTLKGEKKKLNYSKERKFNYNERNFGSFRRTFSFSERISSDGIIAEYENGVLNITIPKMLKEIPKEFQIKIN